MRKTRSIASCYSEHAVKVSDSYCSGPSNKPLIPSSSVQNSVTSVYRSKLNPQNALLIALTWRNSPVSGPDFTVTVTDPSSPSSFVQIPQRFRNARGSRSFMGPRDSNVRVSYDLSAAKYEAGPEPKAGFYLTVFFGTEIALEMGDGEEESGGRYWLICRREEFCGLGSYRTTARFDGTGREREICVKCGRESDGEICLSVCLDGRKVISVERLTWNFRGSEAIFLDGKVIDMMWDVHDWFYKTSSSGCGLFMFRTRSSLQNRLWLDQEHQLLQFNLLISASKTSPGPG